MLFSVIAIAFEAPALAENKYKLCFYILGYFEANVTVKSDFVRVDVETEDGIQRDLHMSVQPKDEVLKRTATPLELSLHVILIMFDSTSAAHFWRKMKKTTAFLKKDLTTVFLKGNLCCSYNY